MATFLRSPLFVLASVLAPLSVFVYNERIAADAAAAGVARECADWLNLPLLASLGLGGASRVDVCGWDLTHVCLFLFLTRLTGAFGAMQLGGLAWCGSERTRLARG